MADRKKTVGGHRGLQVVTLCISTSMVLILLGLVIFFVLLGRNLSESFRENIVVTMLLEQDMTDSEAQQLGKTIKLKPYVKSIDFISKEEALKENTRDLGTDPSEFIGTNPFLPSLDVYLKAEYANNDSLKWISSDLKKYPKVQEVSYQHDLVEKVNRTLAKIGAVLVLLAVLLTFISFSLINNTIKLGIYARRFSIHTMKLVGASWAFIRRPFIAQAVFIGFVAALLANIVLAGSLYVFYLNDPELIDVITWYDVVIVSISVFLFGMVITAVCANISVNKFLRMKAGELYKI